MALGVIAHARQPRSHDPVWVKPVPTKLISADVGSPSHHADRCNHGSSSTASCGCPEHVPACGCGQTQSRSTYFDGREIFVIDGLPESTSRDSVETMGSGTGEVPSVLAPTLQVCR